MTERINRVIDCVGREWHVTEAAVREDYIKFLMDDGLSREQAEQAVDTEEGKRAWGIDGYWFVEQIVDCPRHVMAIGVLTKDISAEEKQAVVDLYAKRGLFEILP